MPLLLLTAQVVPALLLLLLLLTLLLETQDAAAWLDPHASQQSLEGIIKQQQNQQHDGQKQVDETNDLFITVAVAPFVNR